MHDVARMSPCGGGVARGAFKMGSTAAATTTTATATRRRWMILDSRI